MKIKVGRGGKRAVNWRQGDRSEYLATYALSRIGYVVPQARQEDFGVIDAFFISAYDNKRNFYPKATCCIQIKSNEKKVEFFKDSCQWISENMAFPLLILVVNKNEQRVKIFSTWNIWTGLFDYPHPDKMTLYLNKDAVQPQYLQGKKELRVQIGNPIIDIKIDEFESHFDKYQKLLNAWIEVDQKNLSRKYVARNHVFGFRSHITNEIPDKNKKGQPVSWYVFGKAKIDAAERDLAPILTALAHTYRDARKKSRFMAVKNLMSKMKRDIFDAHGQGFIRNSKDFKY